MTTLFKKPNETSNVRRLEIYRVTGESFSEPKRAWLLLKLKAQMKQKTVQFFYQKVNGEIRQAFGTLRDEVINTIVKETGRKP